MKNKPIWPWIGLLVAPYPLLVFNIIISAATRSVAVDSAAKIAINITLLITGIISVLMIILSPVWIILLILALVRNQKKIGP